MRLSRRELLEKPELLDQVVASAVEAARKLAEELEALGSESRIPVTVQVSLKARSSILKKLASRSAEKGREQTLADLSDLARCRMVAQNYGDLVTLSRLVRERFHHRIVRWEDTLLRPRANGYTGSVHVDLQDLSGTRRLELHLTLQDILEFEHTPFPVAEDLRGDLHDLVYKGLGGKDLATLRSYRALQKEIVAINRKGRRVSDHPEMEARIRDFRRHVADLYRQTPRELWGVEKEKAGAAPHYSA